MPGRRSRCAEPGARSRARATAAVLSRLAAQAPDSSALERHLAIEQTVAGARCTPATRQGAARRATTFAATFAAIHGAQHYLYLEYYIFEDVSFNGEQLAIC